MKKYNRKYIGETFISNEGYSIEVVDGGSKVKYCTIRIDGKYEREAHISNIKDGKIKNIYHQSVYDVGFFGLGNYSQKTHGKIYKIWNRILQRCYSEKYHKRHPAYKYATVCKEWHNFQIFAKWCEYNYIDGYDLDKDLLGGDKIYSPETCIFIPPALNAFLANNHSTNKSGYIGVSWDNARNKWDACITDGNGKNNRIGYYTDIKDASAAYKAQRKIYAQEWRAKMNGILPQEAIGRIR